jgi:hypothetical protein
LTADVLLEGPASIEGWVSSLGSVKYLTGSLTIQNSDITSEQLNVLVGQLQQVTGDVYVYNNANLRNLEGLRSLSSVGGNLRFDSNINLANVEGLRSLINIAGDFYIGGNTKVTSFEGLRSLKSVRGQAYPLTTCNNGVINCVSTPACNTFAALPSCLATYVGSITVTDANVAAVTTLLRGYYKIQGNVNLESTTITDEQLLTAFGHVQQITGYLIINYNTKLASTEGVRSLTNVGWYLNMYSNTNLVSVEGLRSLTNVGGHLDIEGNTNLASVEGLRSLKSIRGTANGVHAIVLYSNPNLARGLPFPALTCKAGPVYPESRNSAYVIANIPAINSLPPC